MKMGIWLRKAVLFAAVLGALGAVSKTVEASASEFIRGADISILSDMENLVQNIMKTIFQKMP